MPELRHDPLQRRWVIISTERGKRPTDFKIQRDEHDEDSCPFCPGRESLTPPEIFAIREPGTTKDTPGWKVRVVPNKFPALRIEGDIDRAGIGVYDRMNGIGAHEVIIEIPEHNVHMAEMQEDHLFKIFRTYRERLMDLLKDDRFKYIIIFKNHGSIAGASLSHSHTQLIATPVTPRTVAVELQIARSHHYVKERCIICDILAQERDSGDRIISTENNFISLAPYA
ncbi:MAG: DUF4931 domain-containing protein, partial [Fidelibacterota bacterium]